MFHQYVTNVSKNVKANKTDQAVFSYYIAGAIGSSIGVLHKWIAEDYATPAEQVADVLAQIFMTGILPWISGEEPA